MAAKVRELVRIFNERVRAAQPEGYILQGSVVCRYLLRQSGKAQRRYGPYYLWTRKVAGKTVTVALSKEQAAVIREAVARNHALECKLADIRALSEKLIRAITPSVARRNRQSAKA